MSPRLSVIVPVRDRSGDRVDNCLRSLIWQRVVDPVEIILIDYGSASEYAAAIAEAARRHGARLVRTEAGGPWNRSRAHNIGIRAALGEFVMCTDVDMVFSPNFLSAVLAAQVRHEGSALVQCRCLDLPKGCKPRDLTPKTYKQFEAVAVVRETNGTGGCQCASREFFLAVRGFDEKYVHWGSEDRDMTSRAVRYGLAEVWLDDTSYIHQWHSKRKDERPLRVWRNRIRFWLTRHIVVKNWWAWGQS